MHRLKMLFFSLLTIGFLLLASSCSGQAQSEEVPVLTPIAQTVQAGVEQTSQALITYQMATAAAATPTPTQTLPFLATFTSGPTHQATQAASSYYPTAAATTSTCDVAGFVSDVTIPDGTVLLGGNAFVKTWQLRNDGTCTWTEDYTLVFYSGAQMSGPSTQQLTDVDIAPGETLDISVNLVSPTSAGTYYGYWMLENADGVRFAIGTIGSPFYVNIVVNTIGTYTPTATATYTPTVEEATATTEPTSTSTDTPEPSTDGG